MDAASPSASAAAGESPSRCTTCGTDLPSNAQPPNTLRCPGCGKVFGEDNRCPSCHAVAAVTPSGKGYVCLACGAPRDVRPGTSVIQSDPVVLSRRSRPPAAAVAHSANLTAPRLRRRLKRPSRASVGALRAAGILLLAAGIAGAAVSVALTGGAAGFLLAAAAGGAGVGVGGLLLRAGGQAAARADRIHDLATEQAILNLAAERQGILRVTDVARGLGITVAEADEALSNLADGSRVSVEITPDGLLVYHFREIEVAPRVRVDVDDKPEEQVEVVEQQDPAHESERRG